MGYWFCSSASVDGGDSCFLGYICTVHLAKNATIMDIAVMKRIIKTIKYRKPLTGELITCICCNNSI
jgi:hypothetical protein